MTGFGGAADGAGISSVGAIGGSVVSGEVGTYEQLAASVGALVDRKQVEYGDSFHKAEAIIKVLWPEGIPPEAYVDALAVIRLIDKLFRIANGKQGDEDPWWDIAGYALLGAMPK